ncbi:hypothetical protein AAFF_G00348400 [Aldrovandia affinis]|uniref:B30.2/SPRY domain-containing protein n=1 Tax=Aldrovandia affinis TaxID=143900 RepID=A0AAD7W031_9TELE|nr:hypothetical protein AAFF_G00348400 [Aldrovandia affinis]
MPLALIIFYSSLFCRFCFCNLPPASCEAVASTLHSAGSQLTELDLSSNALGDSGVKPICRALASPRCGLLTLILSNVSLGHLGVRQLRDALCSEHCRLQTLDLSNNELGDCGVELLCPALRNKDCKLRTLRLSGCGVTEAGCASLASALRSNPSHLRELDLSYNHPGDSVKLLSDVLQDKLNVQNGGKCRNKPGLQKYACPITLEPNTANKHLSLSKGNRIIKRVKKECLYPEHPHRFGYYNQALCREGLSGSRFYWEVEWSGRQAHIGVAYQEIVRKGAGDDSCLGQNDISWSLRFGGECCAWHRKESTVIPSSSAPASDSGRVGVYLDWPAGTLSFYNVSDGRTHLHTFCTTFTQPLYPGFRVMTGSVTLCSL